MLFLASLLTNLVRTIQENNGYIVSSLREFISVYGLEQSPCRVGFTLQQHWRDACQQMVSYLTVTQPSSDDFASMSCNACSCNRDSQAWEDRWKSARLHIPVNESCFLRIAAFVGKGSVEPA